MVWLISILSTPLGRSIVIGLGVITIFFLWLWRHDVKIANQATDKLVTQLNTSAEKLADDAVEARKPSLRPGAFARLRNEWCTNCNQ